MDRKYPNALAYIKIEALIRVKQKLWAVKIWAKMIWKQPSSFQYYIHVHVRRHIQCHVIYNAHVILMQRSHYFLQTVLKQIIQVNTFMTFFFKSPSICIDEPVTMIKSKVCTQLKLPTINHRKRTKKSPD